MIKEAEVPGILANELSEIKSEIIADKNINSAYKSVHQLLNYTFLKVKENDMTAVNKCFGLADKLYRKGNKAVKSAIENVFVFSFSQFPVSDANELKRIKALVPIALYSLYLKQVICHGV